MSVIIVTYLMSFQLQVFYNLAFTDKSSRIQGQRLGGNLQKTNKPQTKIQCERYKLTDKQGRINQCMSFCLPGASIPPLPHPCAFLGVVLTAPEPIWGHQGHVGRRGRTAPLHKQRSLCKLLLVGPVSCMEPCGSANFSATLLR